MGLRFAGEPKNLLLFDARCGMDSTDEAIREKVSEPMTTNNGVLFTPEEEPTCPALNKKLPEEERKALRQQARTHRQEVGK